MIGDLRQRLTSRPFEPFLIITSCGHRYRIATAEHAAVDPRGSRVLIWFDDGSGVEISALHIVALEQEPARAA